MTCINDKESHHIVKFFLIRFFVSLYETIISLHSLLWLSMCQQVLYLLTKQANFTSHVMNIVTLETISCLYFLTCCQYTSLVRSSYAH